MKLKEIYDIVTGKGLREDPRAKRAIDEAMKKTKEEYRKAKGIDKRTFDTERLKHPYADTRILNGTGKENIKNILVGIDIDVQEILLADKLREKGQKIDLVISHHPAGRAYAEFYRVMDIQPGIWEKHGLKKEIAESLMKDRMDEVARGVAARNHTRAVDAAKLLGIPMMCIHTAADNCVTSYLQRLFNKEKPKKLRNILSILKRIPEYKYGMKMGAGPVILTGKEESDAGRILVDMTGGTSGPDKVLPRLSQSGIKTIVGMHCRESAFKLAKGEFLNYVIAGHMSSDTLGLNIVFDELEKKEKLKFVECSGFKRIRR